MLKGTEKEIERIRKQISWMETRPSSEKSKNKMLHAIKRLKQYLKHVTRKRPLDKGHFMFSLQRKNRDHLHVKKTAWNKNYNLTKIIIN